LCVIALFYHIPPTTSTPSSALTGARSPTSLTLAPRGRQGNPQMEIPMLSSKRKFTCPECGQNAWAKPGARLNCGECYGEGKGDICPMVAEQQS
jgi:hypothetical protein